MKPPSFEPDHRSFEFGPFRLDPAERILWRDGAPVPLLPKSFDALLVLVRNSGRLLDKDFLLAEIWPDTHVEENNLAHAISDIRKALGEGPKDQRYVVTVPRRGYRFIASIETVNDVETDISSRLAQTPYTPADGAHEAKPTTNDATPVSGLTTAKEGTSRRWSLVYGVAGTVVIAVFSVGVMLLSRQPQVAPLGERDVLVLADFTNNTGEAVFDGTLREALAVQLEQSPFLKVMDDAQIRQAFRLMGRAPDQRVTNEAAREVCVREREKAMISGSIAGLAARTPSSFTRPTAKRAKRWLESRWNRRTRQGFSPH